jgi:hypothetical protein
VKGRAGFTETRLDNFGLADHSTGIRKTSPLRSWKRASAYVRKACLCFVFAGRCFRHSLFSHSTGTSGKPGSTLPQQQPRQIVIRPTTRALRFQWTISILVHRVKKKNLSNWRDDAAESSSSEKTEASTTPKDVLELGRFLVSEALGPRSNDTLCRWLLHAIAERIKLAEEEVNPSQRNDRENEAAELILRLWKHRAVAPIGIDPLARYERLFKSTTEKRKR